MDRSGGEHIAAYRRPRTLLFRKTTSSVKLSVEVGMSKNEAQSIIAKIPACGFNYVLVNDNQRRNEIVDGLGKFPSLRLTLAIAVTPIMISIYWIYFPGIKSKECEIKLNSENYCEQESAELEVAHYHE